MSTLSNSFEEIEGGNIFAGNRFSGPTTISILHQSQHEESSHHKRFKRRKIDTVQGQPQHCPPTVCRHIPFPRNDGLVHRDALTTQLFQLLPGTPGYRAAALWGLGGSGKTQVALNYVYERQRDPLCSIFWVHADSEASFTQDYETIARKLHLGSHLTGKGLLRAVCDSIENNPNWVLVLDEADNLTLFGVGQLREPNSSESTLNLNDFIPKCLTTSGTGTLLWTSRDRHIAGSLVASQRAIHVIQMTAEEGVSLLSIVRDKKTEEDETSNVRELLTELEHLPLAISQAAAYMRRTSTPIEDYLADIRGRRKKRWKILETWSISIEYLRKENKLIYDIMHCLAFVDNQNIPSELIGEIARVSAQSGDVEANDEIGEDISDDGSSEDSSDELDVRDAIARLCEFEFLKIRSSLPEVQERVYDMHKLVQEATRYRLQKGKDETKGEAYFAKTAFQLTKKLFPAQNENDWQRCEQYLAHAQQSGIWAELHNGQLEVAFLLIRVGDYLMHRGRDREAEVMLSKALGFCQITLGDRNLESLNAIMLLASVHRRQRKCADAESILLRARQICEESLSAEHPATLIVIAHQAFTLIQQGKRQEAEVMLQHILIVLGANFGIENPTMPDNIFRLAKAIIYKEKRGDVDDIWQTRCGPILFIIGLTGETLCVQKKYKEAEDIFRPLLALCQEKLDKGHYFSSMSMGNLGRALMCQNKYKEAEQIFRVSLTLHENISEWDWVANISYRLGTMLEWQGKFEEAEDFYRRALGWFTNALGRKHRETLEKASKVFRVLRKQGKHQEAEELARNYPQQDQGDSF